MDHVPVKGTITVSGTGKVTVQPDTSRINLGVIATHKSSTDAQHQVATGVSRLLSVLTGSGIRDRDITTVSLNVRPISEHDRDGNYTGVSGYEVSTNLTVIVRNLDSVGTILEASVANGANSVNGIEFYIDNPTPAASEARKLAVADARASAGQLAEAAGLVVTGVQAITEKYSPPPSARQFNGAGLRMMRSASDSPMPINAGESEITVEINVAFEIAPTSD